MTSVPSGFILSDQEYSFIAPRVPPRMFDLEVSGRARIKEKHVGDVLTLLESDVVSNYLDINGEATTESRAFEDLIDRLSRSL